MNLAIRHSAKAVTAKKTIIEPNKSTVSLIKLAVLIFGSFAALYTTATAVTIGSSQSRPKAVVPISAGTVKFAIIETVLVSISFVSRLALLHMSQINCVYNTKQV